MTDTRITPAGLRRMLLAAADKIVREESNLNALDAVLGDGDHGITMRLGFEAVTKRIGELASDTTFETLLRESGLAFMGATGGAIGVILGKMLMGGASSLRGISEMGTPEFKTMMTAMNNAIAQAGRARPGDKTILDAVHAAANSVDVRQGIFEALSQAACAAAGAAQGTANMICRVGRASKLGDRALGHPDPGAVSFSIILQAFAEASR